MHVCHNNLPGSIRPASEQPIPTFKLVQCSVSSVQRPERVDKRTDSGWYRKAYPNGKNLRHNRATNRHGGGIPSLLDYMSIVLYTLRTTRWTMTSKPSQKYKNSTRSDRESAELQLTSQDHPFWVSVDIAKFTSALKDFIYLR